ncbi:MAG: hypothetical protein AAGI23_09325 [Bacteroidota bacterium]
MKFRAIHTIYLLFLLGILFSFAAPMLSSVFISLGVLLFVFMSFYRKPTDAKKPPNDILDDPLE